MIILKKCKTIILQCNNPFSKDFPWFPIRINQNESIQEFKRRINERLGCRLGTDFLLRCQGNNLGKNDLSLKSYNLMNNSKIHVKSRLLGNN
jgi:hypothetical protein